MLMDRGFLEAIKPLYSPVMGTEAMGPLLYSLICFSRPQRVLEVGAGYTTPFILKALADTHKRHVAELAAGNEDTEATFVRSYYRKNYQPRLLCLDNDSHPDSTASKVLTIAGELGLMDYLEIRYDNFEGFTKKMGPEYSPFDLVWFDCGGMLQYALFINEYWEHVNKNGGMLLLHSTLTNMAVHNLIKGLKLNQATKDFHNYELLSLLEPHKRFQNSVTMIRMTAKYQDMYYSVEP
jgi:predicted O-methyltransferase YrrM